MNEYLKNVTNTEAILNVKSLENTFKKGGFRIFNGKGYKIRQAAKKKESSDEASDLWIKNYKYRT